MVSFPLALKLFFTQAFKISGRSTPAEFWWVVLAMFIANIALSTVYSVIASDTTGSRISVIVYALGMLALLVPFYTLTLRRLHDTNKTGFWLVGYVAAIVIPLLASLVIPLLGALILIPFSFILIGLHITLFVFCVLPSNPGSNMYGPPSQYSSTGSVAAKDIAQNPYGRVSYPPAQIPVNYPYPPQQPNYQNPQRAVHPQQPPQASQGGYPNPGSPVYPMPPQQPQSGFYAPSGPIPVPNPPTPPQAGSYIPQPPPGGYIPYNPPVPPQHNLRKPPPKQE